jgi:hypothetical protein
VASCEITGDGADSTASSDLYSEWHIWNVVPFT